MKAWPHYNVAVGDKFGRMTISKLVVGIRGAQRAECVCDCGNSRIVRVALLKDGTRQSCGCFNRERIAAGVRLKHGHDRKGKSTREYQTWYRIKQRCYNPNEPRYAHYGGRGIKMCKRWFDSFEAFYQDMGNRPPGTSIDRFPNNDGDYEPGNCRWATPKQQANNMRVNVWFTLGSKTMTQRQWEESMGFRSGAIKERLRRGWSVQDALTIPKQSNGGQPSYAS